MFFLSKPTWENTSRYVLILTLYVCHSAVQRFKRIVHFQKKSVAEASACALSAIEGLKQISLKRLPFEALCQSIHTKLSPTDQGVAINLSRAFGSFGVKKKPKRILNWRWAYKNASFTYHSFFNCKIMHHRAKCTKNGALCIWKSLSVAQKKDNSNTKLCEVDSEVSDLDVYKIKSGIQGRILKRKWMYTISTSALMFSFFQFLQFDSHRMPELVTPCFTLIKTNAVLDQRQSTPETQHCQIFVMLRLAKISSDLPPQNSFKICRQINFNGSRI